MDLEKTTKQINDNLTTLVAFHHKVVKSKAESINTMVNRLEKMYQSKNQVVDVDVEDGKQLMDEDLGPCKRTHGNLKRVVEQSIPRDPRFRENCYEYDPTRS